MTELSAWALSGVLTLCDLPHGSHAVLNKVERILTSQEQTTISTDVDWMSSYGDQQITMINSLPTEIIRTSIRYMREALPAIPINEEGNKFFDSLMAECDAHIKKRPLLTKNKNK